MKPSPLRAIPSVDQVLRSLGDTGMPHPAVVALVRRELAALRKQKSVPSHEQVVSDIRDALEGFRAGRIQAVINATGILIHTNFGRAPLGPAVIEALTNIGAQYNNLEFALAGGMRGGRAAYLENNLALLCEAEAATVVNNNAAALVLILRHFCAQSPQYPPSGPRRSSRAPAPTKNEVIISRGELIQIGGGFRIPEILESSGARLREVGTTNKTSLADYARAITRETALILKVHRSNFFMDGFVESPPTEQIAALARKQRVPFAEDLGSGAVLETESVPGLEHEPTPAEVLRSGADLVCFSGDKLLGGPQAGILAGNAKLIAALKREPLYRAVRCDKLILAALEGTVDLWLGGCQGSGASNATGIPVLHMLRIPNEELRARAGKLLEALAGLPLEVGVGEGRAQVGGGTLPRSVIPSVTLDLVHRTLAAQEFAARLRAATPPVIGYIERGKLRLDLRTIFPSQDPSLVNAIRAAV